MRVGLVCPYSLDVQGGVQSHVGDLAEALTGLGHQVQVLAPGEQAGEQAGHLPAYVTTTGRALPMPYNGSVARVSFGPLVAARVRRWLDRGDFDVLHIHEPATPSVSVLALWSARTPVVATFHTAQERSWALETSAATFLRAGLAKIDAHIAVSDEAHRTMDRYLDASPVVIPNGVHTARYSLEPRARGDGPRLLFIGRVDEPRKGLQVLLDAMPQVLARHPDARLTVVGGGRRSVARRLDPHVAGRVEFTGVLTDAAKARALAAADMVIAPNTYGESFGIVLVEAMAAGAAVVASDLPAFRQVLGGGRYGALCEVGDPGDLARTVTELIEDRLRRGDLVRRARRAVGGYDWSVVAPRVVEVYESVVDDPPQAAAG
jgi:phosphatidylinositol alpha-mannosyltransferase